MTGGDRESGAKAIIPAHLPEPRNLRLVPDQDPDKIDGLLPQYVAQNTPPPVRAVIRTYACAKPRAGDRGQPALRAAAVACRSSFGATPGLSRSGGTTPVVHLWRAMRASPIVLGWVRFAG